MLEFSSETALQRKKLDQMSGISNVHAPLMSALLALITANSFTEWSQKLCFPVRLLFPYPLPLSIHL